MLVKRFTFLPSLWESILKNIHYNIIPRTRERGFPGLNFHSTDVEREPAVLKEIPPLMIHLTKYFT